MKYPTAALLFVLSGVLAFGQAMQTKETFAAEPATHIWHRSVSKDDVSSDRLTYYLQSVEDENVVLLVGCKDGEAAFAGLNFPFTLYGGTESPLKYESASGEVMLFNFPVTDGRHAIFTSRAEHFKPVVGGAFSVEDTLANLHTYHLPAAGTAPFDGGCKTGEELLKHTDETGAPALDDIDAKECREVKGLLSGALQEEVVGKDDFRKLLEKAKSGVPTSCDLSEFDDAAVGKPKK